MLTGRNTRFDKDIYSNMLIEPNIIKTFRPTKI